MQGAAGVPEKPQLTPMEEIKGGFILIGRGVKRALKESAAKKEGGKVARMVVAQLTELLRQPAVIKTGIHLSSMETKFNEIAADIGRFCVVKLGFREKADGQMAVLHGRFEKIREGLQLKLDKEGDPRESRRLSVLRESVSKAKTQAETAHQDWKQANNQYVQARANFRTAVHRTDLARIDVRVARKNLDQAKAELSPYERLGTNVTPKQAVTLSKLRAKVTNAEETVRRAEQLRNGLLREEEEAYNRTKPLGDGAKRLKAEREQKLSQYERALKQAQRLGKVEKLSMRKKVMAEASKLKESAQKRTQKLKEAAQPKITVGSRALISLKAKTAVKAAIQHVDEVREKEGLHPLNKDVREKVQAFLKEPKAATWHAIGDAIRHQDEEDLKRRKQLHPDTLIGRRDHANLFYAFLSKKGIKTSTINW